MKLEEVKALGTPFRLAQVQISRTKKISRLVLAVSDGGKFPLRDNPAMDLDWQECDDIEEMGTATLIAARQQGLIAEGTQLSIIDLDRRGE